MIETFSSPYVAALLCGAAVGMCVGALIGVWRSDQRWARDLRGAVVHRGYIEVEGVRYAILSEDSKYSYYEIRWVNELQRKVNELQWKGDIYDQTVSA